MFLNAYTRLFSRWAKHPQFGINALLPQIPRHGGDPAVGTVDVLDDVDSEAVQLDYEPSAKRSLIVCVDEDVPSRFNAGRGESEQDRVVVGLYYLVKDMTAGQARKEGEYVMAAAAFNQQLLARRDFVEGIVGAPTVPLGTTDPHHRVYAGVEVVEITEQVAVRTTKGPKDTNYVGVLFTVWKGASLILQLPGVP